MTELFAVPPELVALGDGLASYFAEHASEFKKGAKVSVEVDFGQTIEVKMYVEVENALSAELELDRYGKWHVLNYYPYQVFPV